jgi:hypothetical protein
VSRGAKWASKLVEGLCPPVLHVPCHPLPPPPPISVLEAEELPGGVRPVPDQPVRSAAQATSAAAGPPSPVAGWVEMARVVLLHVCPPSIRCKPCCVPHSAPLKLLLLTRDQRMLVSVGALLRMLLAIACLGHIQQRPGSDLPQLRAGVLHWLTSSGLPAVEVFEVTSHLVWTYKTTDGPRQLLGPRSSLSICHAYALITRSRRTARRQAHRRFVVQALRHSAATREQVDAVVTTFVGCFGRLWRVPWENGYKEVFWRLVVNGVRAAGACQRYFSAPCPCGVVGSGALGDGERLRQHAFWECAIAQAVHT